VKYLLDTHILLWSLLEPDRLSDAIRVELENHQNELWVSPISAWEMALLVENGRITIEAENPEKWIREMLTHAPVREAPLNLDVALASRQVDLTHQDPADRFIAATALVYDLVLLTADARLLNSGQIRTLE
jgi:PIN domain nuclease of toxin-antitoxin system